MGPVPINKCYSDTRYVTAWERLLGPKCKWCKARMKEPEYAESRVWVCRRCDYIIHHRPKTWDELGLW